MCHLSDGHYLKCFNGDLVLDFLNIFYDDKKLDDSEDLCVLFEFSVC